MVEIPSKNITDVKEIKRERPIQFEDALTLTKFGKFNYFLIIVCGMNLALVLLETLGISFVLPVAQCDLKLTTQHKGVLSAIGFAGIISSSHLWGFLADTTGRRRVILPTLFISFLCTLFSSLTNNFWLFTIFRYFNGFFIAGSSATVYAYLGEFHNVKYRSRAIMAASFIFGIGGMLLPALAWLVINQEWEFFIPIIDITYKPWRLFLVVCGLPSLFCSLALLKIPESPKYVLSQSKQEETIKILQWIYSVNTGKDKETLKISSIIEEYESIASRKHREENTKGGFGIFKSMWAQTAPLFMEPYIKKTLIACILQFGIFATSNGMYMWFPDILNRIASYSEQFPDLGNNTSRPSFTICEAIYSTRLNITNRSNFTATNDVPLICNENLDISTFEHTLVLEVLYAVGFALIGVIINTVGKLSILVVVLAGCGACGAAAVFTTIPLLSIYLYLILLLCGLAVTVVNAATVELFPTHLRAMAVCISLMMGRLGSVVGANLVGVLLENNCTATFLTSGISLILCAFLSFSIPNVQLHPLKGREERHSISSFGQ